MMVNDAHEPARGRLDLVWESAGGGRAAGQAQRAFDIPALGQASLRSRFDNAGRCGTVRAEDTGLLGRQALEPDGLAAQGRGEVDRAENLQPLRRRATVGSVRADGESPERVRFQTKGEAMNKIAGKMLFSGVMALVLLPCAAKADEATAAVNLDNLVPYTQPAAAWSDRYSNVTLTWQNPAVCGPQRFASLVGSGGTEICPRLLSWTLAEEGKSLPLAVKSAQLPARQGRRNRLRRRLGTDGRSSPAPCGTAWRWSSPWSTRPPGRERSRLVSIIRARACGPTGADPAPWESASAWRTSRKAPGPRSTSTTSTGATSSGCAISWPA